MSEIALGVGLFVAIVMILTLIILFVRAKLLPTGEVEISINESRSVTTQVGESLLNALAVEGIYLSSACGGRGTCGQCRVRVRGDDGGILPTERAHINKREAADGMRLACVMKIKQPMAVEVPAEVFGVKQWEATVRSNYNIATLIKELVLNLPAGETIDFSAGSYVQISCPPYRAKFNEFEIEPDYTAEWDRFDLWKYEAGTNQPVSRAYSMANYPAENTLIMLDVRIAVPPPGAPENVPPGIVSSYLFNLKPGDKVAVAGPFGNFFAADSNSEMIFIGGGVGMAPMRSHIFDQLKSKKTARKINFWYGARNLRELLYREDFERLQTEHENFQWSVALSEPEPSDDWQGFIGFIHEALFENYLKDHPAPEECEYYLCGPPMMVTAVINMLESLGVDPDNVNYDDFGG